VPAYWYHDIAATWDLTGRAQLRIGVNNVADEQPAEYAPNVQSGTDPSTYDVVGRRAFAQINLKF
jgi:outer membrane receptor protein involved in Fe transport